MKGRTDSAEESVRQSAEERESLVAQVRHGASRDFFC